MGGIFHGRDAIDDTYGPDRGGDFDASAVCCPRCGSNVVEVLSYPRGDRPRLIDTGGKREWRGHWFGATGRAECEFCGCRFSVEQVEEDDEQDETQV